VDLDGNWFVNFALSGAQGWEDVIVDIQSGTDGGIFQGDADGDGTTYQQWRVFNQPPVISALAAPLNPIQLGQSINATVEFTDPDVGDTHTVTWNWGDGSTTTASATVPSVTTSHTYSSVGVYTISATITDAAGESDTETFQYVVIYDPNGGFVTGGGWINSPLGAYTPDPTLTGKATFGFVSKYQKGASVPTGNTEFQFHVAGMNFRSTSYDWLVIAGTKAQYKGTGTINGAGEYKFMLTAIDGSPDKFRIKIWDKATETAIYDNQLGAEDTADPTTSIQGGSIVVHKAK
jgi:PKD repeat protein